MILVDTSIWVRSTRDKEGPESRELDDLLLGDEVATTEVIVGEVLQGTRSVEDFLGYQESLRALHFYPAGYDTWERAARLSFDLRRQGRTVPLPDLVIATVALDNDLALYTLDSHFDRLPGLKLHRPESVGGS